MKHAVVDGVDVFSFRQSWIGTFQMCPEQARLEIHGKLPRVETEATAIGTAVHAAIEAVLGTQLGYDDAQQLALQEFVTLSELPEFTYVGTKSLDTCLEYVVNCFTSWYEHIYPVLGESLSIERNFRVTLDSRHLQRIDLTGTWDLDDSIAGLVDWKNKGSDIKRWEVDRWGIQPTVYTYAKRMLDLDGDMTGDMPFTFVNMVKSPYVQRPQVVEVRRNEAHYAWLRKQLWQIVDMYTATNNGEQQWQLNDAGWWCSPKWCTNWDNCKGATMGSRPW